MNRRRRQSVAHYLFKLFRIEGGPGPGAAQRKRRANDRGIAGPLHDHFGFCPGLCKAAARHLHSGFVHRLFEEQAILSHLIASRLAPIISTPHSSSTPESAKAIAKFKAVWPPTVGNKASGRSRLIIAETDSTVSGSM